MLTLTRQNQQLPFIWILSRITTGQCTKKQQQQGQPRGPSNYMYIQCTNSTHMHFQQNTFKNAECYEGHNLLFENRIEIRISAL